MIKRQAKLPWVIAFVVIFYGLYAGANYLAGYQSDRLYWHLDWEIDIPFLPATALVYLSVNVMGLWVAYRTREVARIRQLFVLLLCQTLIAAALFVIFPVRSAYPERIAQGLFANCFWLADQINLDHNKFPSLHTAFALTFASFHTQGHELWNKLIWFGWAAAIALSTLFMHEHHLAHVLAGAGLSWLSLYLFARVRHDKPSRANRSQEFERMRNF